MMLVLPSLRFLLILYLSTFICCMQIADQMIRIARIDSNTPLRTPLLYLFEQWAYVEGFAQSSVCIQSNFLNPFL